jgi:sucrose-6-phosphate hydrolase SacC (GH32 family)
MADKMNRRDFMKNTLIGSGFAAPVGISLSRKALAQQDEFNTRVVYDYVSAIHLYRDKLIKDKYRPRYHFAIPEGIAHPFDPNGAIYWKGRYHLFYIFQPYKPRKGHRGDCWAHISSHDLVHWRFHPTALKPQDHDPEVAIYSGNAFLDKNGIPTIIYQGLGAGNCIAQAADDNLDRWEKSESNPVIPYPEFVQDNDRAVFRSILDRLPEYGKYDVWDPHAWLDGDTYYAISGDNDLWPAKQATLWKSEDLKRWELVGDFFHHDEPRGVLDCPDFFKLSDKYVLLFLNAGLRYTIGDFKNEQFYPEKHGTMTWNCGVGYAPESLLDHKGRRIMWAALNDSRTHWGDVDIFITKHGWAGALTLPRVLSLDESNELNVKPADELRSLRADHVRKRNLTVRDSELEIDDVQGNDLELDVAITPQGAKQFGIRVCCAPDGSEQTTIAYNSKKEVVCVDLSRTSLDRSLMAWFYEDDDYKQEADLKLEPNATLNFRVFLDRSVIEIFVNNRLCLTHRIYPKHDDSKRIVLFAKGGNIRVPKLDAWKMHPSNPW